jgi:DNA polymerase-3 subunit epsilon
MSGPSTLSGVLHHVIKDTSIAVLDFETTGLSPGLDRVVEVSVVRVDPGSEPRLVFDTLVNPERRMAATEVHGLTDQDVTDAPRFADLAGDLVRALSGCVVAAHNVYFDLRFLRFELDRLGLFRDVPHLCTMYMRPLLGLAACKLNEACLADRIAYTPTHSSRSDSTAAALLWMRYCERLIDRKIATFHDLTQMGRRYKFFSSFACETFGPAPGTTQPPTVLKPRREVGPA